MSRAHSPTHIIPSVPHFLATYLDIRLDISLSDEQVDLLSVGADLAIGQCPLPQARAAPTSRHSGLLFGATFDARSAPKVDAGQHRRIP
jgi:DNA-binding transcriptional LysR family regulator